MPAVPPGSRTLILDVAERLMSGDGYDRTSIVAVCRESGLPVGSIYHHFGSKAGLLAAVMERWGRRFFARIPAYSTGTGDPHTRFREFWDDSVEAITAKHDAFVLQVDLTRLAHHDAALAGVMRQVSTSTRDWLGPTFRAFAADLGVTDAAGLAAHTEMSTRGLVLIVGPDLVACAAGWKTSTSP